MNEVTVLLSYSDSTGEQNLAFRLAMQHVPRAGESLTFEGLYHIHGTVQITMAVKSVSTSYYLVSPGAACFWPRVEVDAALVQVPGKSPTREQLTALLKQYAVSVLGDGAE